MTYPQQQTEMNEIELLLRQIRLSLPQLFHNGSIIVVAL